MTVTAVLLTGKPERRSLALVAIECFRQQTHADAELLIVNHSGQSFGLPDPRVREILVSRPGTLGHLRNIGLDNARGEHVISWDDDDWHHPRRIELQLAACTGDVDAVVLGSYLVLDLKTGHRFGRSCRGFECGGCCGTILHRRTDRRYPALERDEDAVFVRGFGGRVRVLDNAPSLYVRTYSGFNVSSRYHVVEHPSRFARTPLTSADDEIAQAALALYAGSFPVGTSAPPMPVAPTGGARRALVPAVEEEAPGIPVRPASYIQGSGNARNRFRAQRRRGR